MRINARLEVHLPKERSRVRWISIVWQSCQGVCLPYVDNNSAYLLLQVCALARRRMHSIEGRLHLLALLA
jgi:hypothetical protein